MVRRMMRWAQFGRMPTLAPLGVLRPTRLGFISDRCHEHESHA